MKTKKQKYLFNDPENIQGFYRIYDTYCWIRKANFLKDTYDNSERIQKYYHRYFKTDLGSEEGSFKRSIALDIHFLGFQAIETLFELLFALYYKDNRYLWITISNSDWKSNYKKVKKIAKGDFSMLKLDELVDVQIGTDKQKIDKIRWLFYYLSYETNQKIEWEKNTDIIKKVLSVLAQEFTDRDSYNAYKHSLRLYSGRSGIRITPDQHPTLSFFSSSSENGITYLSKKKNNEDEEYEYSSIQKVTELIDIERDHSRNLVVGELIYNMITSRQPIMGKNSKDTHGNSSLFFFNEFDRKELYPKMPITKFTMDS